MKEKLKQFKANFLNFGIPKYRLQKSKNKARKKYKELNGDDNITILSPNCIGGEIYNLLGLKFNSPLINSSMKRVDFIDFCLNLDEYLKIKPKVLSMKKGHPILTLESPKLKRIDINFIHDDNQDTVINNWEKRKKRIIKDKIYVIMDNKDEHGNSIDEKIIKKIEEFNSKKKIIFVTHNNKLKDGYEIGEKQIKRYNFKKISGLYGFQYFFDYVDFLTKK
ncbi:MAG: DUF1919 domain-containing protein [Bacilli bacterium]|nr:DUF1919 domain-containing protein [Bacilli bacterium]